MRLVGWTWAIGGTGLVLAGVIGILLYLPLDIDSVLVVILDVVFAAAVLLFAIGLSKTASVVARRPLGVIALTLVALWHLAIRLVHPYLPEMDRQTEDGLAAFSFGSLVVSYAAALIGSRQIARAATVPSPWRWAPLWAAIFSVAVLLLRTFLFSAGVNDLPFAVTAATILSVLDLLARTLGLGILALILASRVLNRGAGVPPSSPLS